MKLCALISLTMEHNPKTQLLKLLVIFPIGVYSLRLQL